MPKISENYQNFWYFYVLECRKTTHEADSFDIRVQIAQKQAKNSNTGQENISGMFYSENFTN